MGTTRSGARFTARRFAAFLAALGVLVMSSGLALMVTAAPASANHHNPPPVLKDWVCKYVGTPGVNERLKQGNDGLVWVSTNATEGAYFNDGQNRSFVLKKNAPHSPKPSASSCPEPDNDYATAGVEWIEPSCENGNTAGYETSGEHVTWSVFSGSATPGSWITLKAKAEGDYEFDDWPHEYRLFVHKFDKAEDCTAYDASADVQFTDPECENENTASYTPTGNNVTFEITDGEVAPGEWVEITATATDGHAFEDESKTKVFTHTFDPEEICVIVIPPRELTPEEPTFVDPTCDVDPSLGLPEQVLVDEIPADVDSARAAAGPVIETADVDGIHYEASGSLVPGGTVEVVATLIDPETTVFAPEVTTAWSHTFTVPTGCTSVAPPVVDTPSVDTTTDTKSPTVVTPTVVSAGLASDVVQDARAQQGLALVVAGMVLLMCAGGLGLVRPGAGVRVR